MLQVDYSRFTATLNIFNWHQWIGLGPMDKKTECMGRLYIHDSDVTRDVILIQHDSGVIAFENFI
jgi:hypothetical protein